jgi:hypothetical protein
MRGNSLQLVPAVKPAVGVQELVEQIGHASFAFILVRQLAAVAEE